MSAPRDRKLVSLRGLFGGLSMFAIEGMVVAAFAFVAFLFSTLLLAIL